MNMQILTDAQLHFLYYRRDLNEMHSAAVEREIARRDGRLVTAPGFPYTRGNLPS